LVLAIYQPQAPKTSRATPAPKKPIAQTVLSFGDPLITSSSSSTLNYSIPVYIATGENSVTAVQLELQYDPVLFTKITATPGAFFAKPNVFLNQIDSSTGRISYAFGVASPGASGKGTVADLTFSVNSKVPNKTAIIFLPKTLVTAEGISGSALQDARLGQFTIGIVSITPSASPAGKFNR
jgi:hypothetical protein